MAPWQDSPSKDPDEDALACPSERSELEKKDGEAPVAPEKVEVVEAPPKNTSANTPDEAEVDLMQIEASLAKGKENI